MPSAIAVTQKRNIGMVCVNFTKIIHDAFGFMLYVHTAIILSLKPSIFSFYSSSLSKMKKHCYDIMKHSRPTNVLIQNNPLKRTAVLIFLSKMYR